MGKDSPKQPEAPNPAQVSAAQSAANVETAIANAWLNSGNQVAPWGNTATNQIGTQKVGKHNVPIFSQQITLSPEQQKLYEQGVQGDTALNQLGLDQIGRIKDAVAQPFSLDAFGPAPVVNDQSRSDAYNRILARAAPEQEKDRQAMEARLAAQGIALGSEAYGNAQQDFNRGINDFRLGADIQAGNALAQDYGLRSSSYQQQIANALLQRERPLQEFAQFTGNSNAFQSPSMVTNPGAVIQPTDVTSPTYANYNAQLANYQNGQANNNALWGSLAGLAGAGLGGWASSGFSW